MINLIKYEWKKLFQWKFLFILLPLVLVINGVILSGQIERERMASDSESQSYQEIHSQQDMPYEKFLDSVEEQAENMKESLFFQGSKFNRDNLDKTEKIYKNLHGIEVEKDYKDGLRYVTDYRITDILLILAVIGILLHMMIYERSEGFFSLIKPAKNGRGKLISAKYVVMIISILILTLLFFGTNYFIVSGLGLTGSGAASIQSLEGYMASPYKISVNQYLVLFLLFKSMAMIAFGSIVFFICVCCRNQIYTVLITTAMITGETFLWHNIENYSWISPLKQLNFVTVMDTSAYFNDYINFNLFGKAVSSTIAGIVFMLLASGVALFLSVLVFAKEASAEARITKFIRYKHKAESFKGISASLFKGEFKKILFMQKGLLLIIILLLIQTASYYETPFYMDKTEVYYKNYSSVLEGKLSPEKEEFLRQEEQRFEELEEELNKQYERYEKGEINEAVLNYYEDELTPSMAETEGFERAEKQYERLKRKEGRYKDVTYIYETGWDKLLGTEGRKADIFDTLKLFLILLLAFAGAGTCEKQTSAELLIQSSYKGKKSVSRMKHIICAMYALCAAAITFSFRVIQIGNYYTLPGLDSSIQSLTVFNETKLSISIGTSIFLIYIAKAVLAVIAGQIVLRLSEKLKQEYTVLFLSCLILIVPVIVAYFFLR